VFVEKGKSVIIVKVETLKESSMRARRAQAVISITDTGQRREAAGLVVKAQDIAAEPLRARRRAPILQNSCALGKSAHDRG